VLSPEIVIATMILDSRRTMPDGEVRDGEFAITSVWQKNPEGWRVSYAHESTTH